MMMAAPKRVAIYTRVSLDRTGEGLAVDRQLERCRKQISARDYDGWKEVGHYSDNSISAYTGKERPEWNRLLADIKAGRVDIVLAWHLDRLTRSMMELEQLIQLCEQYDVDITTIEGDIDLSRSMGRLVARILAAVARAEVEMKTARQLLKWDQTAVAGKPFTGGVRAFGYEDDRVTIVPEEAEAIRKAAQDYLAGKKLAHIADEWTAAGLRGGKWEVKGDAWTATGVRGVLENPRYAAIRMHRGEPAVYPEGHELAGQRVIAQWPAIIDEDTHNALLVKIRESSNTRPDMHKRKPGMTTGHKSFSNLLSGILACNLCGNKAQAGKHKGRSYYTCSSPARHFTIQRHLLDQEVSAAVIAFLSMPDVAKHLVAEGANGDELIQARADADKARTRLAQLGDDYADGLIDRETMLRATERLRERLVAADEVLAQSVSGTPLDGFPVGTEQAAELWSELELYQQRGIIETVAKEIIVRGSGPGRRWDPSKHMQIHFVGNVQIDLPEAPAEPVVQRDPETGRFLRSVG